MFTLVAKCQFASEVWFKLEADFVTESKARALHLKNLLQITQKGNLNIHDYVKKMKGIAESLSTSGQVISDEDLLQHILDGLGPEFDAVVVNLTSRVESTVDPVTLQEAQFLLQKYELRLDRFNSVEFHGGSVNVASLENSNSGKNSVPINAKVSSAPIGSQSYPQFSLNDPGSNFGNFGGNSSIITPHTDLFLGEAEEETMAEASLLSSLQ
ncbi:uncharacterized protein LOC116106280 [Pistacia vera]|uniref:uncharacterized protein LOC116106280 n=1 Tax=Pistacia vera TaxID=55513 RepID=UPI0012635F0A|nr:uncharacterized protein LOC116106280 [Pistacia vera]